MILVDLLPALTAFGSVVLIDVVLAGDNAVVVGTAASGLPPEQQRKVIALGAAIAFLARCAFSLVAVELLDIIGLLLAGGLLLLWVGWKMWRELHCDHGPAGEEKQTECKPGRKTFRSAALQVAAADVSMSLDNVLAVAGAARDHPLIMIFGLVLSVALMAVAAGFIARLIDRHRWLAYAGLLIIVYVALTMIWEGSHNVMFAVQAQLT